MRRFYIIYDLKEKEWYGYESKEYQNVNFIEFKDIKDLKNKLKDMNLIGYVYEEELLNNRIEGFGWFDDIR